MDRCRLGKWQRTIQFNISKIESMRMKIKSYEDLTLEKWQALRSIDWNEDIDDV